MLILKFHKKSKPFLGKGSFVVPVFEWKAADELLKLWHKTLDHCNRGAPNDKVRFATLARLPDSLPVSLHFDWSDRHLTFLPWKDHPLDDVDIVREQLSQREERRQRLAMWGPDEDEEEENDIPEGWKEAYNPETREFEIVPDIPPEPVIVDRWPGYQDPGPDIYTLCGKRHYMKQHGGWMPEIVLGGRIPPKNILWTKDHRLLTRGDQRQRARKHACRRNFCDP